MTLIALIYADQEILILSSAEIWCARPSLVNLAGMRQRVIFGDFLALPGHCPEVVRNQSPSSGGIIPFFYSFYVPRDSGKKATFYRFYVTAFQIQATTR
ncbi:hypothetical protein [Desulfonatronovibrio magnus]|uniref:hypothetical protein n=1 Tax=Desulfonatronovibrio magnus TaxID=698827 RepID=UPI0005EB749B|nr:hypothetical protein [Desulfonatronovibrio magnus]